MGVLTGRPRGVAERDKVHDVVLHLENGRVAAVDHGDARRAARPVLRQAARENDERIPGNGR